MRRIHSFQSFFFITPRCFERKFRNGVKIEEIFENEKWLNAIVQENCIVDHGNMLGKARKKADVNGRPNVKGQGNEWLYNWNEAKGQSEEENFIVYDTNYLSLLQPPSKVNIIYIYFNFILLFLLKSTTQNAFHSSFSVVDLSVL